MLPSRTTASAPPPALAHAAVPFPQSLAIGTTLGRVEIIGKLGSGGMADVWLGRIRSRGDFVRLVAVKSVHSHLCSDARSRAMFFQEAMLAASIRHANVVDVHDVGEADGVLYQVMTLVEGEDFAVLQQRAAPEGLPIGLVVSVIGDALLGLHAAHEAVDEHGRPRLLVHRDISPHNILVGLDGVARVSDFGIAKALAATDDTSGSMRGKVAYFSPEQAAQRPLDRRSDVFAMGIVLWEALTRSRLFRRPTVLETLSDVAEARIPDPREKVPSIPAPLAEMTLRALERDIAKRYPTAEAMAQDLTRAARDAGCLLPRTGVAQTIEALAGEGVRAKRARLFASASPALAEGATLTTQAVASAADHVSSPAANGERRGVQRAAKLAALLALTAGAIIVLVQRDAVRRHMHTATNPQAEAPTALDPASATPQPAGAPAAATPVPSATGAPAPSVAVWPSVVSSVPRPPSSDPKKHVRGPAHPAPPPSAPAQRKAPFDENPFDSPGQP